MKQDKVHFYCGRCDKTVGQLLEAVLDLQTRQDRLEEKIQNNQDEVKETIQGFISTFMEEAKTKDEKIGKFVESEENLRKEIVKVRQELARITEETKSLREGLEKVEKNMEQAAKENTEIKTLQDMDINKQVEQLTEAYIQDERWSDIVKKQIDTKFGDVEKDLTSIQKLVVDTKNQVEQEKDKENRSRNIIIYKVEESNSSVFEVRNRHDRNIVDEIIALITSTLYQLTLN